MSRCTMLLTFALATASVPALGQVLMPADDDAIVVVGDKRQLVERLKQLIEPTPAGQLARFEKPICPAARGLSADINHRIARIIRDNVVAAGGKVAPEGCSVNAVAIFVGQPSSLLVRLNQREPSFFDMTPRAFDLFAAPGRAAYSWHLTDTYGSRGQILRQLASLTYQDPLSGALITTQLSPGTKLASDETGSRLTTGAREEVEAGFVVVDRGLAEGKSLRQLADFATLHLMLDLKSDADQRSVSSILALFRSDVAQAPRRMSVFDRHALAGFYGQKYNNRSAIQQTENIAAAMRRLSRKEGSK